MRKSLSLVSRASGLVLISVCCLNSAGSRVSSQQKSTPIPAERYALVVGVGTYQDKNISRLWGDNDALALAKSLELYAGFPKDHIIVLTTSDPSKEQPTRLNILRQLSKLAGTVSSRGLLLFAFSGHGMAAQGESLLFPSDLSYADDPSYLKEAAVTASSIARILKGGGVKHVLMFLDACRNEPLLTTKGQSPTPLTEEFAQALEKENSGVEAQVTFFASAIGQPSYQSAEKQMGYFTYALTQALAGKGDAYDDYNQLTLYGLSKYLSKTVPALVAHDFSKREQKPSKLQIGSGTDDFILVRAPEIVQGNPELLSGSRMLITPDGKEIYVTNERLGIVNVLETGDGTQAFVDLRPGRPSEMVMAVHKGQIYVLDSGSKAVIMIDAKTHQISGRIPVGDNARSLAITPDEHTLYVSNVKIASEGAIGLGRITVVDLTTQKAVEFISGVNCPEGLAITPDGKRLYVSSQCGFEQDPVFVISTQTNKVVKRYSGFGVGLNLILTRDGAKVYVARGNYDGKDSSGNYVHYPDQLSVIDTRTDETYTIKPLGTSPPLYVSFLAVTPDNRHVLAIGGAKLIVIDSRTDEVIDEKLFDTPPAGIVVGRTANNPAPVCYVWLSEERRLFFTGLSGILGIPSRN